MQTTIAAVEQVILHIPLHRLDGKPDNSPLSIAAALAERGFSFSDGEVCEVRAERKPLSRTLTLTGNAPCERRSVWLSSLVPVMRELSLVCIDIDEQDTAELAAKLDGALLTS